MSVKCRICNQEFGKLITSTHLAKHNMKTAEYKIKYGKESLSCPEYRLQRSHKNKGKNNPNYGNVWSEEQKQHLSEVKKENPKLAWNTGMTSIDYTEDHLTAISRGILARELKYKSGEITRHVPDHTPDTKLKIAKSVAEYALQHPHEMKSRAEKATLTKKSNGYYSTLRTTTAANDVQLFKDFNFDATHITNRVYLLSCNTCNSTFTRGATQLHDRMCPGCSKINSVSSGENELIEVIRAITNSIVLQSDRRMIPPFELDIYIPSKNVAIEFNGSYWHSELSGKDKNYHATKTALCKEKGIHLIHIWEHEWNEKQELITSRIKAKLGANTRVFARKCQVQEINSPTSKLFINGNHIQGNCPASIRYGMYYDSELIGVMTFGKSRYSKKVEYELLRYCTKQGVNIVGGAGKLFKRFTRDYNNPSVISYSDRSWNTGSVYEAIGLTYSHTTPPAYHYTKDYVHFENRVAYQKHKLKDKLKTFDPGKTEWENMQINGYDRIWDCGNDVYIC